MSDAPTSAASPSLNPEELVSRSVDRWKDSEEKPESYLLHLAILRELIQALHSEKSRCLANGKKVEAQTIKNWEARIDELRDHSPLRGELMSLISASGATTPVRAGPKKKRLIPEALFTQIEREKFERYDRNWEAALASEAATQGWHFWSLEAWVKIPQIEEWDRTLAQRLWPHGIVVFAESASLSALVPGVDPAGWHGRWIVVMDPHFKTAEELSLNLSKWPGAAEPAPHPPRWKLLFSPKKR